MIEEHRPLVPFKPDDEAHITYKDLVFLADLAFISRGRLNQKASRRLRDILTTYLRDEKYYGFKKPDRSGPEW